MIRFRTAKKVGITPSLKRQLTNALPDGAEVLGVGRRRGNRQRIDYRNTPKGQKRQMTVAVIPPAIKNAIYRELPEKAVVTAIGKKKIDGTISVTYKIGRGEAEWVIDITPKGHKVGRLSPELAERVEQYRPSGTIRTTVTRIGRKYRVQFITKDKPTRVFVWEIRKQPVNVYKQKLKHVEFSDRPVRPRRLVRVTER